MSWLVAVDPGIDATGVACFNLAEVRDRRDMPPGLPGTRIWHPAWRAGETFTVSMRRLGPTTVLRTKPEQDLVERLRAIGNRFGEFAEQTHPIATILIERPTMPGAYARGRDRQRTKGMINGAALEKLYLTIGVLLDSAISHSELKLDGRVELIPAPRLKKELRHRAVVGALQQQRHSLVAQSAPRLSPDLLDAIYLGATWLSDTRRLLDQRQTA